MVKRREYPIEVSTYQSGRLHFAVGVSDSGKIVRIVLPCETEEEVLAEISREHPDFEVTADHVDLAKTVSDAYHGKKVKFNLNTLELGFSSEEAEDNSSKSESTPEFVPESKITSEEMKSKSGEMKIESKEIKSRSEDFTSKCSPVTSFEEGCSLKFRRYPSERLQPTKRFQNPLVPGVTGLLVLQSVKIHFQ